MEVNFIFLRAKTKVKVEEGKCSCFMFVVMCSTNQATSFCFKNLAFLNFFPLKNELKQGSKIQELVLVFSNFIAWYVFIEKKSLQQKFVINNFFRFKHLFVQTTIKLRKLEKISQFMIAYEQRIKSKT
jgi:hypothetical protein